MPGPGNPNQTMQQDYVLGPDGKTLGFYDQFGNFIPSRASSTQANPFVGMMTTPIQQSMFAPQQTMNPTAGVLLNQNEGPLLLEDQTNRPTITPLDIQRSLMDATVEGDGGGLADFAETTMPMTEAQALKTEGLNKMQSTGLGLGAAAISALGSKMGRGYDQRVGMERPSFAKSMTDLQLTQMAAQTGNPALMGAAFVGDLAKNIRGFQKHRSQYRKAETKKDFYDNRFSMEQGRQSDFTGLARFGAQVLNNNPFLDLKYGAKVMRDGGFADQVPVELENDEVVFMQNEDGSYEPYMETSPDAPRHEEGGVKTTLPKGAVVFPGMFKDEAKMAYAYGGKTGDWSRFNLLKEKMLHRANKAHQQGKPFSSGGAMMGYGGKYRDGGLTDTEPPSPLGDPKDPPKKQSVKSDLERLKKAGSMSMEEQKKLLNEYKKNYGSDSKMYVLASTVIGESRVNPIDSTATNSPLQIMASSDSLYGKAAKYLIGETELTDDIVTGLGGNPITVVDSGATGTGERVLRNVDPKKNPFLYGVKSKPKGGYETGTFSTTMPTTTEVPATKTTTIGGMRVGSNGLPIGAVDAGNLGYLSGQQLILNELIRNAKAKGMSGVPEMLQVDDIIGKKTRAAMKFFENKGLYKTPELFSEANVAKYQENIRRMQNQKKGETPKAVTPQGGGEQPTIPTTPKTQDMQDMKGMGVMLPELRALPFNNKWATGIGTQDWIEAKGLEQDPQFLRLLGENIGESIGNNMIFEDGNFMYDGMPKVPKMKSTYEKALDELIMLKEKGWDNLTEKEKKRAKELQEKALLGK